MAVRVVRQVLREVEEEPGAKTMESIVSRRREKGKMKKIVKKMVKKIVKKMVKKMVEVKALLTV